MKRNHILFLLAFSVFASCEKKLELAPLGAPTTATFYKNAEDAKSAVTGAYSSLQDIYGVENILTPTTVGSDDGVPFLSGNADRRALWSYNILPTNNWTSGPWYSAFQAIQRCNVVISRLPAVTIDENLKKRYIAEVKYIRAMMYFNLVRFYGSVPLVTDETTSLNNVELPRAKVEDVYALIESDLKEGEATLPKSYAGADIGRATQGVAKGLLAKVYLTRAGNTAPSPFWSQAAAKAKEVMDLGVYDLWANYADVFDVKNKVGKESLFEVVYLTDVLGNPHTTYWAPRSDPRVPGTGFGTIRPTKSLWDQFAPNDKRRDVTFLTSYIFPSTGATVNLTIDGDNPALAVSFWKLADLSSKIYGGGGKSFPYMRFAEILLIYAEALNEVNGPTAEAYAAINRVRSRAGLSDLGGLSKDQFRDAVLKERRVELAFEGHRWFDLVRTGRLVDAVKAESSFGRNPQIQPFHVLFPIPSVELGANKSLVQNPGY